MDYSKINDFINGLSFPNHDKPGDSIKIAQNLEDLSEGALLEMAGYKESSELLADSSKMSMYGDKSEWLEQFEGSPLYEQAIALCEQDLQMEQQHLAVRQQRRAAEQAAGGWEQESNDRDMMRIQKQQLTLALHKTKAQSQAAMAAATAPAMPGGEPEIPAEATPEEAATKMAAMSTPLRGALMGAGGGALLGSGVGAGVGALTADRGRRGQGALRGGTIGAATGAIGGGLVGHGMGGLVDIGKKIAPDLNRLDPRAVGSSGGVAGTALGFTNAQAEQRLVDAANMSAKPFKRVLGGHTIGALGATAGAAGAGLTAVNPKQKKQKKQKVAGMSIPLKAALGTGAAGALLGSGVGAGVGALSSNKGNRGKGALRGAAVGGLTGAIGGGMVGHGAGKALDIIERAAPGAIGAGTIPKHLQDRAIAEATAGGARKKVVGGLALGGLGATGGAIGAGVSSRKKKAPEEEEKQSSREEHVAKAVAKAKGEKHVGRSVLHGAWAGPFGSALGRRRGIKAAKRKAGKEWDAVQDSKTSAAEVSAMKVSAMSDAKQEKGLGKAIRGLAKAKMDPDQKRGLMKGLGKAIQKEEREGDPVKLAVRLPSRIQAEIAGKKAIETAGKLKSRMNPRVSIDAIKRTLAAQS